MDDVVCVIYKDRPSSNATVDSSRAPGTQSRFSKTFKDGKKNKGHRRGRTDLD